MKRFFTVLALACATVCAFAQNSSVLRPRIEIAEVSSEENNNHLQVFYMNDENPRMYYLSLGNLGIGVDILQLDIDPVYELFIPLGGDLAESISKLEEIKALYNMSRLETSEIYGSFEPLYPSDNLIPVTVVSRKLLASKILQFSIPTQTEDVTRANFIYKSDFNSLLVGLKIYKKLHPKQ